MAQTTLYELNLDFAKEMNYSKAVLARQGDKGITITVNGYLHGLPMIADENGFFTLKATTPTGLYVDASTVSVTGNSMVFQLDGSFLVESGYYQRCYVEYRTPDSVYTTQDIILYATKSSDPSTGEAKAYISQLEKLIELYNQTFDDFMKEIQGNVDVLNGKLTDINNQATTLKTQLDDIQSMINTLAIQKYKLTLDTGSAFTLADIKPTPTNYALIGLRQRGWVYLTDVETQTMTDYASLPTQMKTDAHRIFNMPADGNGVIQIIFNASYMCWRRVSNSGVSSAWQLMATSADIANLTNVVNNLNTDLTGKIEQEKNVNNSQDTNIAKLTTYVNRLNQYVSDTQAWFTAMSQVTEFALPSNIIDSGSLRIQSRNGVVTFGGSGRLAKDIAFGEIIVENMGDAFKNIGKGNVIFTGAVTGNLPAQLYVEYNTSRLRSNTAMTKGQWLTLGGSYITDVAPIPTLPTLQ
jgi:hypothetical protein